VTTLNQSEAVVGVLAAMQLAPGGVLAMLAGGFVDHGRKRRILIAADLIRAGLVGSLTLAWALGVLSMMHVVVVGAGVGAASALFQIADVAYLSALIASIRSAAGAAHLRESAGRGVGARAGAGPPPRHRAACATPPPPSRLAHPPLQLFRISP